MTRIFIFPRPQNTLEKITGAKINLISFYPVTYLSLNSSVVTSTNFLHFWQLPAVYRPFAEKTREGQTCDNVFTCRLLAAHEEIAPRSVAELFKLPKNLLLFIELNGTITIT